MNKRIFIAINLPENIKKKLTGYQNKWQELPVKYTNKENLHITLIFLGYLNDEELVKICDITKKVVSRNQSFSINLNKICYGPPHKIPPRMIWAEGKKSEKFTKLQTDLEKNLLENFTPHQNKVSGAGRVFSPHITLGRLKQWEFRQIEQEKIPEINEEISLNFEVNSIEVMESQLRREGPKYTVLESIKLEV